MLHAASCSCSLPTPSNLACVCLCVFVCVRISVSAQAWSCALAWLLLLRRAKLYSRYRLWILTVLRLSMACVALQCTSSLQVQLRSAQQPQDSSRAFVLIMQLLLVTNMVHIPMVAIRLKMPMVLQLVLTALQPLAMLWSGILQGAAPAASLSPHFVLPVALSLQGCVLVIRGSYACHVLLATADRRQLSFCCRCCCRCCAFTHQQSPLPTDLVTCASSHGVIQGVLRVAIECWGSLLESGKFMPVADSSRLEGRSSAIAVVLCTLYSTTVTLTLYVCYMRLWGDQLRWLQENVAAAAASSSGGAAQAHPPPLALNVAASSAGDAGAAGGSSEGESVGFCSVDVHALCLRHRRQLQRMCSTPVARLLFNRTGIRGKLSAACIQASVVNMLCLGCLLLSQGFAQKLLPWVIPHSLDCCYPLLPAT